MFVRTQKVQNTVSTFSKGTPRPADDDPTLRVIISVIGCLPFGLCFFIRPTVSVPSRQQLL